MADEKKYAMPSDEIGIIGFSEPVIIDRSKYKKVLITGKHSYIGESFENYAKKNYAENFEISTIDMIDGTWKDIDFSLFDIVFHVAGIAHADVGNVSDEIKQKYYKVNTELAIDVAKKAKEMGVKQFVFMSSMIVYGDSAKYGQKRVITKDTIPVPSNFYGDSKWQADKGVRRLESKNFNVTVLRPPMIYGKESKGNYPMLAKLAKKLPVFPNVKNERSMLHIDNLCEFLCQIMLIGKGGVFIPQNEEYTNTSNMVEEIAKVGGKCIHISKILNPAVWLCSKVPGKISGMVNKAFGNMTYAQNMSEYPDLNYRVVDLKESIKRTEERISERPKALILASVASMIDQFNMQNIRLLLKNGYQVDVACNCKEGNTISDARVKDLIDYLNEIDVSVIDVPIPRKITNLKGVFKSLKQVKRMCNNNCYDLLHCHSPIGSVVARLAAKKSRKHGTKIIYTAHGFHFYKGAPKINWIIFYPIEKFCSRFTDVLITINKEDYNFAKKHMKAKNIEYIPGVGVDTKKFKLDNFDKSVKRKELGLNENDIMILSVGELNQNKNHEVAVKAIARLNKPNIHYYIAGQGEKEQYLNEIAESMGVNLHLLGYRTDIVELLNVADIFVFPSFREGLSVALMEAMAAGLPCIVSEIRGNVDLIDDKHGGFLCKPDDVDAFCESIKLLIKEDKRKHMGEYNRKIVDKFDVNKIMQIISEIYFADVSV